MRRFIGIAGCPGAGKSTLAGRLAADHDAAGHHDADDAAADHDGTAVVVPMDGFHLAQRQLDRLGRAARKGAPDTFDVDGFVALLARIRHADATVYAPAFDRHLEEPIAGAIAVTPHHTLVIIEGNYLLHDRDGWERVRPLLDECWYVEVDENVRRLELVARHVEHGRTPDAASAWVREVDESNAELVRRSRSRADRVVGRDTLLTSPRRRAVGRGPIGSWDGTNAAHEPPTNEQ